MHPQSLDSYFLSLKSSYLSYLSRSSSYLSHGYATYNITYKYGGKIIKNPGIINRNLISPVRQVSTIIGLIISNTWFTFRDVKDIFTIFIIVIIAYFTFVFCRFMNQELFSL